MPALAFFKFSSASGCILQLSCSEGFLTGFAGSFACELELEYRPPAACGAPWRNRVNKATRDMRLAPSLSLSPLPRPTCFTICVPASSQSLSAHGMLPNPGEMSSPGGVAPPSRSPGPGLDLPIYSFSLILFNLASFCQTLALPRLVSGPRWPDIGRSLGAVCPLRRAQHLCSDRSRLLSETSKGPVKRQDQMCTADLRFRVVPYTHTHTHSTHMCLRRGLPACSPAN